MRKMLQADQQFEILQDWRNAYKKGRLYFSNGYAITKKINTLIQTKLHSNGKIRNYQTQKWRVSI